MPRKRAHIPPRTDLLRTGPRADVVIPGKCQVGERPAEDVLVTDLSARGCRLRGNSIGVTKTEPVQLWLGDGGPGVATAAERLGVTENAVKLAWLLRGAWGARRWSARSNRCRAWSGCGAWSNRPAATLSNPATTTLFASSL